MNTTSTYERFAWSVFDNSFGATRDGVDFQALAALAPNEYIKAGEKILAALYETNDPRPFIAAGAMKLLDAAPIIKQRLLVGFRNNIAGYMTVHAAQALYLIEQWPEALDIIIKILQTTPKTADRQWTRMMAVEALSDFPNNNLAATVLFSAVEDEDEFVGFLAIESLKKIYQGNCSLLMSLERLQETQITPNRWKPEFLERRQEVFQELQNITGVAMPNVSRFKHITDDTSPNVPETKHQELFPSEDTRDLT